MPDPNFTDPRFSVLEPLSTEMQHQPGDLSMAMRLLAEAVVDEESESHRKRVQSFVGENPDALHRSCLAGHLTASALVVDPINNTTLLIHHRKLGRWLQPGGHADGEGNLRWVALDEASEETGLANLRLVSPAIDVDVHQIPTRGEVPAHLHLDVRFLVLAEPGAVAAPNEETLGARWHRLQDEQLRSDPSLGRLVVRGSEVVAASVEEAPATRR